MPRCPRQHAIRPPLPRSAHLSPNRTVEITPPLPSSHAPQTPPVSQLRKAFVHDNLKLDVPDQLSDIFGPYFGFVLPGTTHYGLVSPVSKEKHHKEGNSELSSPPMRCAGSEIGPIGSVRGRFLSVDPLHFFDLTIQCSISRFGLDRSADGSGGKPLGFLQIAEQ